MLLIFKIWKIFNNEEDLKSNENMETFEVDSIELATPELFSDRKKE